MPRAKGKFGIEMGAKKGNDIIFFEGSGRVKLDRGQNPLSDKIYGTRMWTSKYEIDGKVYGNRFEQRVEVLMVTIDVTDAKGNVKQKRVVMGYNPISNAMMDDKGRMRTTVERSRVFYHTNGESRLDTGFDSLIADMRAGGVPLDYIDGLTTLWDSLSDSQKASVFNQYRTNANIITYGSSAYNENNDAYSTMDYYKVIRKLVEKEFLGGYKE